MKIFLAGMESSETLEVVKTDVIERAFYSYYYLRKKREPYTLMAGRPHIKEIIVDSGAHSFFSELQGQGLSVSVHVKKTITEEAPQVYWENFLAWLKKWNNLFDYFVELDIGEIAGQDKVMEWREELKQAGLYQKCITVYHPEVQTFEDYLEMLKDSQSKYVALEGDRPKRPRLPYNSLIKPAYEQGIKVHGFAFCKREALMKYPFYSTDATSWKAGMQYATTLAFDGKRLGTIKLNNENNNLYSLSKKVKDLAQVHDKNLAVGRVKRMEIAVEAYKEMERYFTQVWEARGVIYKT